MVHDQVKVTYGTVELNQPGEIKEGDTVSRHFANGHFANGQFANGQFVKIAKADISPTLYFYQYINVLHFNKPNDNGTKSVMKHWLNCKDVYPGD